jgi:hypothetical protein
MVAMSFDLPYGQGAVLHIELPTPAKVAHCAAPRGRAIADVPRAVSAALVEPLGYPPLVQAVVPGDRVVLALDAGLPHAQAVVSAVMGTLTGAGVAPGDITLLGQAEAVVAPLAPQWPDARRLVHDPADRRQMAFLGRTSDQMQIVLNRALVDADVVILLGCLRGTRTLGYNGPAGGLCPALADEPTQRRFRAFHCTQSPRQHAERAREKSAEIAWLLGARFTVQVVPGRGVEVLHVLAGDLAAVSERGEQLYDQAWRFDDLKPASLVVVAVEGGPAEQTWDNVGLALSSAAEVAEPGGAIAICSELSAPSGEALQKLAGADSLSQAEHEIRKSPPPDAVAALELARALAEHHVYLLSRLPSRDVEDLGMVAVSDASELAHLARSRPSCLLLSGGPFVQMGRTPSG